MKNVNVIVESADIVNHVKGLWKTDLFRNAHANNKFVSDVVDKFAEYPKFFFDASDSKMEMAHFSAWWGGIQNRHYDNPIIHDLYLFHEMYHAGTMIYAKDLTFTNFVRKMQDNELDASTLSEILAYFEMPELRAQSFRHEIFVDRFLQSEDFQTKWSYAPERTAQELRLYRRDAMENTNPKDDVEYWIYQFSFQNTIWANVWRLTYNEIETRMATMQLECATVGKHQAMDNLISWLTSDKITKGTDIPFPLEAEEFAATYWSNKKRYADVFNNRAAQQVAEKTRQPKLTP